MAPECVHNSGTSKAQDIWSLACILFQLYTGTVPFEGASDYLIFIKSVEANYSLDEIPDEILPADAKALISQILVVDPTKRLTIEEVLASDYCKNAPEEMPKLNTW